MKKIFTLLCIAFVSVAFAQKSYYPSIIILTPHTTTADQRYNYEIGLTTEKAKKAAYERLHLEREFNSTLKKEDPNIRVMTLKSRKFSRSMDFYSNISYSIEQYLQYKLMEKFPDLLIYAVKQKSSGELEELARLALDNHVQFVINPVEVNSYVENGNKLTKIRFQVFEATTRAIVWEKEYIGGDTNPGSDFACDESSIDCTVNNALLPAIKDMTGAIFGKKNNMAKPATGTAPATPAK